MTTTLVDELYRNLPPHLQTDVMYNYISEQLLSRLSRAFGEYLPPAALVALLDENDDRLPERVRTMVDDDPELATIMNNEVNQFSDLLTSIYS